MSDATPPVSTVRCLDGRLASAYPAARHDVELRVDGAQVDELAPILRTESDRILGGDPLCRKVVFAVEVERADMMDAAEQAGFRYVVDVDVVQDGAVAELSLMVREPHFVTEVDMDLDRVPQT